MRILLLTQWFDPEPTLKGLAFAVALRDAGHDVQVLTGFPNYPGGVIYEGFKQRLFHREELQGIRVVRVPLYPSHDTSGVRRALGYASFALSSAVLGAFFTRRPDVIYAYHPPLTTGLSAAALAVLKRTPFVLDVQDLWPDTLVATGMMRRGRALKIVSRTCRFVYRRAARIVVLSPGFKRALVARGVPADKVDIVYNWADERRLQPGSDPGSKRQRLPNEAFTVVFAGTMGKAQDLATTLAAAALLRTHRPPVRFLFVGGGVEVAALSAEAERMGLPNVTFLPRMAMADVGEILATADALLVQLKDDPLFAITIPSKTQAYLFVGKPVIMAMRGDAADLIERSGGGVVCAPGNPQALADAIGDLADRQPDELRAMGEGGAAFYRASLSLEGGTARFVDIFKKASGLEG